MKHGLMDVEVELICVVQYKEAARYHSSSGYELRCYDGAVIRG